MDYIIFKKKLGQAGLSVTEFAELMHINCNSVSNYSSKGYVPVHLAVAVTLMSEMAYRNIDFKSLLIKSNTRIPSNTSVKTTSQHLTQL